VVFVGPVVRWQVETWFIKPGGCVRLETDLKVRDLIRELERDGWQKVWTRGSHRQFKHPIKPRTLTVAGKAGIDVPPGTLSTILKQAGLKG
jgi:predicted RNA binding protein YcfA (HicA-like mRNA interferase family)